MLDKIAQSFVCEQLDMYKTDYEGYGFCKTKTFLLFPRVQLSFSWRNY